MESVAGLSCWSQTSCVAVGTGANLVPIIDTTTDGMQTWTSDTVPNGFTAQAVDCPSATSCVAVGNGSQALVSSDGFSTETVVGLPTGSAYLGHLACPTTLDCTALGGYATQYNGSTPVILGTTDGGHDWAMETVPAQIQSVDAISCGSATNCMMAASVVDGGVRLFTDAAGGGPDIGTSSLAPANYGSEYVQYLNGSGAGGLIWSAQGLPQGLQVQPTGGSTGEISGTPTAEPGIFDVVISAQDTNGVSSSVDYQLIVAKATPALTVTSSAPAGTTYGSPVTYSVELNGDALQSGEVSLTIGSQNLCTITGGVSLPSSSCQSTLAPVGTDTITAAYDGDTDYNAVSATTTLTVAPAPHRPHEPSSRQRTRQALS